MVTTIYVEGGGNTPELKTACRRGFKSLFSKVLSHKNFTVISCGSRDKAFSKFCIAMSSNEDAVLLVDSEEPISIRACHLSDDPTNDVWQPFSHFACREGDKHWKKPPSSEDCDVHFMVECMENWLIADVMNLKKHFGKGFDTSKIPSNRHFEEIPKADATQALNLAAKGTSKAGYKKGRDSFKILETMDPVFLSVTNGKNSLKRRTFFDKLVERLAK